jgi:ferredoxin
MDDIYEQLARFLDDLPGGYPRTESGVELRILRRLFTPDEAGLALHLTLLAEEARVIAHRARLPVERVRPMLEEMDRKGLIYAEHKPGKPAAYMALHFVVGFWEGQVNRLDRELVEAFEEYHPSLFKADVWSKAPQLRTIPVGEAVPNPLETMPYERAKDMVRSQTSIAVANCICRQEKNLVDEGCGKPLETCLTFGGAAHSYADSGRGRLITQQQALDILRQAERAGLVLQPSNTQAPLFLCACCGCCCGVLRGLKLHPRPAEIVSSPYHASLDQEACAACGDCLERCPMDALSLPFDTAELNLERCIGCGLCVTSCSSGALSLVRKPQAEQHPVPRNILSATLQLGKERGKLGAKDLVGMVVRSQVDRLVSR